MFLQYLYGPSGVDFQDAVIEFPTLKDVEMAIRQLDGHHFNYLKIHQEEPEGGSYREMIVCGGEDGLFFVYVFVGHYFQLIDPSYPDKEEGWSFLVNQSDTECYRYEVNGLEATLKAAIAFAQSGEMEQSLTWRSNSE